MKILIAADGFTPMVNGVVTSVLCLKKGLEELGHEARVLALSPNSRSFVRGDAYFLGSLPAGKIYPQARFRLAGGGRYLRELIRWRPDIVHTQQEFTVFSAAARIAGAVGAPLVHTYHTNYEDYTHYFCPGQRLGKRLVARLTEKRLRPAAAVVVPTEKMRRLLAGYGVRPPVRVIPTGIDLSPFGAPADRPDVRASLGLRDDDRILLFVGRLAREKNVGALIELFAGLESDRTALVIVGDGPYRAALEKTAAETGRRIVFAGMVPRSEIAAYYRAADLFVNASTSETQGLTVVEALASGLPVVSARDACYDGVIENGVNGFQCAPDGLAQAVVRLLSDDALRAKCAEGALRSSGRFSLAAFAGAAEQLYRTVLAPAPSRAILRAPVKP